ncbi:MAG: 1,4-alpha-glucan branching protein GlgB [Oscillospiraceae bacterium]|nr:1,4-alpha-glucan branching protein GlgB [Oscillospiraceae bacterium]
MEYEKYISCERLPDYVSGSCACGWELFGCRYAAERGAWLFTVYAPNADSVELVGDFCSWDAGVPMQRGENGLWYTFSAEARRGQVYKYAVTHGGTRVLKSDPYALHCETGPATGSKVWELDGVRWTDGAWMASRERRDIAASPVSIYEVHLGSWRKREGEVYPNYRALAPELAAYCVDMGYTHVELMPVTEYPFEGSWGYQVTGYFAPTSRYGTPEDFAYLINELHRAGLGVIMDWVPAHFPRDAHGLAAFDGTALYERSDPKMAAHPEWGTLIFDYSKGSVRSFLLSSACFFARKYHIDGIRMDAISSMLYLSYARDDYVPNSLGGDIDLGAVDLLRLINTRLHALGVITVAEESTAYPKVTESAERGGLGFTFKWDMGFMHDTLDYMALDPYFRGGSHNKLSFSMMYAFSERYILPFSHDEVVHGKKSMLDKMYGDYDRKFASLRALYAFQFAHPGKKLTFMGSDFGQFIEWNYKRELDWFLLQYPRHDEMRRFFRKINQFYCAHPAMWAADCGWEGFKWLNVDDADRSCVAFMRIAPEGERIVCAFNFTPKVWELQIGLPSRGRLQLRINSDEPNFGGTGAKVKKWTAARAEPFLDHPCSALLTLPPLGAVYYEFKASAKAD